MANASKEYQMGVLDDLKKEMGDAQKLPLSAEIVMEIARQVDQMEPRALPRDLIFRAAIQAPFGKLELG